MTHERSVVRAFELICFRNGGRNPLGWANGQRAGAQSEVCSSPNSGPNLTQSAVQIDAVGPAVRHVRKESGRAGGEDRRACGSAAAWTDSFFQRGALKIDSSLIM